MIFIFSINFNLYITCRIQEKIHRIREEKEAQEKKDKIEMEKMRRKDGQDLSKIKSE